MTRMFGSRLAVKRGVCWSVVVVPIALVPCPLDWGTLVGIPRLHPPGLPCPRLQYLTLVGELLWELGILLLQFCAHISGNSYPPGNYFFILLAVDKSKNGDFPFVLPDKKELGGAHWGFTRSQASPCLGPIPILVGLYTLREAGHVPARYPIGSVTTVLQLHTLHLYISTPRPELVWTPHRLGDHRDSGNFPGSRSPCTKGL